MQVSHICPAQMALPTMRNLTTSEVEAENLTTSEVEAEITTSEVEVEGAALQPSCIPKTLVLIYIQLI